jgi:glutathione S-transferase
MSCRDADIQELFSTLDLQLAASPYLTGDQLGPADVAVGAMLLWLPMMKPQVRGFLFVIQSQSRRLLRCNCTPTDV